MRTQHLLFGLAAASLIAGGIYLWSTVSKEPDAAKAPTAAVDETGAGKSQGIRERARAPGEIVPTNEGEYPADLPNNGRNFVRRSTSPDRLPDGSPRPEPFQARSKPAKNHALFVGVHDDATAHKVDDMNTAYLRGRYEDVLATAPDLIAAIPENQQLKRLYIRAACLAKRPDIARANLHTVSESDQAYMKTHCLTYGSPLE